MVDDVEVLEVLGGSRVDHPAERRDRRAHADTGVPVGAHLESARAARVAREQRELDLGARPVARDADLLAAVERDADGGAGGARELDRRDRLGGQVLLRAEAATHVLGDQVHLLVLQPEALGDLLREATHRLGRDVNVQALPVPAGGARVRLEGGVDLGRGSPAPLHEQRIAAFARLGDQPARLAAPAARTRPPARAGSRASGRAPAAPPLPSGGRLRSPL